MFNRKLKKEIRGLREFIDKIYEDNHTLWDRVKVLEFELHYKPAFEVGNKIGDWQVIERTVEEYGEWTAGCGHHHYQYTCYDTNKKGKWKAIDTFPQARLIDIKEKLKFKKQK